MMSPSPPSRHGSEVDTRTRPSRRARPWGRGLAEVSWVLVGALVAITCMLVLGAIILLG